MTYAEALTNQMIRTRCATIAALNEANKLGRGSPEHLRAVRRIGGGLRLDLRGIRTRRGRHCVEVLDARRSDGVVLDFEDVLVFNGGLCGAEPVSSSYAKSCYIEGVICDHIEAPSLWGA